MTLSLAGLAVLVALGAAVFGMIGLGGGVLYVPLFAWWGMDFRDTAVPSSLFLGFFTGAVPAAHYLRAGLADLRTAGLAALAAVAGAPLGTLAIRHLPVPTLKVLFAAAVAATAARVLLSREPHPHQRAGRKAMVPAALATGLFAGFASGLLGIGGGFAMLPALLLMGYPTKEAVATSSLVVAVSALSAFCFHLPGARLDWPVLAALGAGATAGAFFAGWYASRHASSRVLRAVIGAALLLVAGRVFWEGLRG